MNYCLPAFAEWRDDLPGQAIAWLAAVHQMHRTRLLDYQSGNRLCVDLAGTFTT